MLPLRMKAQHWDQMFHVFSSHQPLYCLYKSLSLIGLSHDGQYQLQHGESLSHSVLGNGEEVVPLLSKTSSKLLKKLESSMHLAFSSGWCSPSFICLFCHMHKQYYVEIIHYIDMSITTFWYFKNYSANIASQIQVKIVTIFCVLWWHPLKMSLKYNVSSKATTRSLNTLPMIVNKTLQNITET